MTIKSIEYGLPVNVLNRVGETVLDAFDGVLDDLSIETQGQMLINHPVDARTLLLGVSNTNNEYKVGIVASDLTLGGAQTEWGYEFAYNGAPGVVVSTSRLDPESYGQQPNTGLLTRRTSIEAVHGLGHNFGLVHHSPRETRNGYLCPMSVAKSNNWYEYLLQIIDRRDLQLCAPCYRAISRN